MATMDRLTARNADGTAYFPECFERCFGEGCKINQCNFDVTVADKLAWYEDLEENGRMEVFPLAVGQNVYFTGRDSLAENKIKGDWYVLSPHKIVDVSTSGFWTGDTEDFPNNADFTAWTDTDYYTSYQEAKEAIERMVD